MRNLILIVSTILLIQISYAEIPTIKEQLVNLNKNWDHHQMDDNIFNERIIINDNEVKFIQFHLLYVEQSLRQTKTDHLNHTQKEKRFDALDILHKYMLNGVFPKNLFHKERTPYFIDHLGTACAVGYLIINSGYEELAKKISIENNYGYIYELDLKYPQLGEWANEHGFTLDELAWIQPGYPVCDTICNKSISIWASGGVEPYSFHWNNPVVAYQTMSNSQFVFVCPGNFYICTVIDTNGDTIPSANCTIGYDVMISYSNSIAVPYHGSNISTTQNEATFGCNGSALANAANFPPHNYEWYFFNNGWQWLSNTQVAGNLCPGQYKVIVTNAYNCSNSVTIDINTLNNVDEKNEEDLYIYPNPGKDLLIISNLSFDLRSIYLEILNVSGQRSYSQEIFNENINEIKVSIKDLPAGIYNLRITAGDKILAKKFIKR